LICKPFPPKLAVRFGLNFEDQEDWIERAREKLKQMNEFNQRPKSIRDSPWVRNFSEFSLAKKFICASLPQKKEKKCTLIQM
jgi:branched-subunit amino acid aminotransferase/4-amino-4-deoxychorismate lyase